MNRHQMGIALENLKLFDQAIIGRSSSHAGSSHVNADTQKHTPLNPGNHGNIVHLRMLTPEFAVNSWRPQYNMSYSLTS